MEIKQDGPLGMPLPKNKKATQKRNSGKAYKNNAASYKQFTKNVH
jgi:hypothetical protein